MARAPAGARRRGGGGEDAVRKGPWTAEEDKVLLEHVHAHGPRDWSSIRSKGLLPRTGKSCRLRWVNKLRPNLKSGCKFSVEEERVVIELQAQFGNKWARIATYLTGRTDNDVKNFWSTRQKRLARLLRTPLPSRATSSSKKHGRGNPKAPAAPSSPAAPQRRPGMGLLGDQAPVEGSSSGGGQFCATSPFMERHDRTGSGFLGFEQVPLPMPLQVVPPAAGGGETSSSNAAPHFAPEPTFDDQLYPYPLLDFPGVPDRYGVVGRGFVDAGGMDCLAGCPWLLPVAPPPPVALPFFGVEFAAPYNGAVKNEPPDALGKFFDDLPPDMFDSLDHPPPPPPSPSRTNSGF